MSGHYSCGQYNDAFNAKRLKNWQYGINNPGKFVHGRPCVTQFITDCNGHLLPHITRNASSSPWGDTRTCIWEESTKCDCVDRIRNPQDYELEKLPKFYKKEFKPTKPTRKRPQGVKPAIDPILNKIRERRLPIIWMVGLPTERIGRLRSKFCIELSEAIDYAYINLDDCIQNWRDRFLSLSCDSPQEENFNQTNQEIISVEAKLTPSLLDLVIEYDKTPNRTALAYATHINAHRQSRPRQTRQSCSKQNLAPFDPLTGDEIRVQQPGNLIQFTLGQRLTRDKIMELLKYAMIENYPTKGYIIDSIFLDQGDGLCFEKMFYSPAVCTYFTESIINNSIDEWLQIRCSRLPAAQDLLIDKQIKNQVQLIFPQNMRRNKKYSFLEVDKLCRIFESKMIRVLNAEEANQETIHFVYSLLYKHIRNYPHQLDQTPINFFDQNFYPDVDQESEVDAHEFLSPIQTPILPSQAILLQQQQIQDDQIQNGSDICNEIHTEFQKMIARQLPVIWILGLKQISTDLIRQKFCEMLAQQMNFTFIRMDQEIIRWYNFDPTSFNSTDEGDTIPNINTKVRCKIIQRAQSLVKRIVDQDDLLNQDEVMELIKFALMLAHPTKGYILNEFPVNLTEGEMFEKQIYPSTSLIYFLNFSWTVNKNVEPSIDSPKYFRRCEPYSEQNVEKVCDQNGYKAVKVWNAEDLDEEGMRAINNIINECINTNNTLEGFQLEEQQSARRFNPYDMTNQKHRFSNSNKMEAYISPPTAFSKPRVVRGGAGDLKNKKSRAKPPKSPIISTKYTRGLEIYHDEILEEFQDEEDLIESPPKTAQEIEDNGQDFGHGEEGKEDVEDLTNFQEGATGGVSDEDGDEIIDLTDNFESPPQVSPRYFHKMEEATEKSKEENNSRPDDGRGDF